MPKSITVKQLSGLTGVKPRTLQFWTMNGVIECDPETKHEGPGKPRRYGEDEAAIALVLGGIIRMPLQVRALREIAQRLREIMKAGPQNGITDPVWYYSSDEAHYQIVQQREKASELEEAGNHREVKKIYQKLWLLRTWENFEFARLGITQLDVPGYGKRDVSDVILEIAVDDVGRWVLEVEHAGLYDDGGRDTGPAPAVWSLRLLLNLTRTLAPLRAHNDEQS